MFSRFLVLIGIAVFSWSAKAIQVRAFYSSACERDLGLIIEVNPRMVTIITLDGEIKQIPRYRVTYLASYSMNSVPISKLHSTDAAPEIYKIETWQKDQFNTIVTGWPIGFSKDRVAFLSLKGNEIVVPRNRIWRISKIKFESAEFSTVIKNNQSFAHPQIFSYCAGKTAENALYADNLLSDPISIKQEFDSLTEGHKTLNRYYKDQQFYPVPEIYTHKTSLGLWFNGFSRYGATVNRSNNFTPVLIDDNSNGPFSFQRRFVTGAAPLMDGVHEEPQTQVFYGFKADYFHLAAMFDPSTVLVGSSYNWTRDDLSTFDVRDVEKFSFRMGFDYGAFALDIGSGSSHHIGARNGESVATETVSLPKFGIKLQYPAWSATFYSGSGNGDVTRANWYRLNGSLNLGDKWRFESSYIFRNLKYDGFKNSVFGGQDDFPDFVVETHSKTIALYSYYLLRPRQEIGGFVSLEQVERKLTSPTVENKSEVFPKLGVMTSLSF